MAKRADSVVSTATATRTTSRRISLRVKWMALISAAVFVSLLGSTFLLFAIVKSSLHDTFSGGNAIQAESATREIRLYLSQYEKSVEQLAREIGIAGQLSGNEEQAIDLLLQTTRAQDPSMLAVYFTPVSTGKTHASPSLDSEQDGREASPYKLALQNKQTSWTDVHWNEKHANKIVSVVTPVWVDDEPFGVVGYDIDLSGIGALRESNEKFGDNQLVIYDDQGLIVSSFMQGMDGKNIDPQASGTVSGAQDVIEDTGEMRKTFGWIEEIEAGRRGGVSFKWAGEEYQGEVSFVYSNNWSVVSFKDTKALNSSMLEFLQTSAIASVIGLVIGAMAAYSIAARLLRTIRALRSTIARTADGDLVSEFIYLKNDEIGDLASSYNSMLSSVRAFIRKVHAGVNSVEETANGVRLISNENAIAGLAVARSTEEIATGASNTSLEIDKSSEAVRRLSEEIGTLIAQSNEIELVLEDSGRQVRIGNEQVFNLESSYVRLERAFGQVTDLVADLSEKSESISAVTKIIAGIASQTNILSINAAIEASRAGEHGRGFAVVAKEVRMLAEQAGQYAKQIQAAIAGILSHTHRLVDVVNDTNEVNRTQKDAVSEVSFAMKRMNESLDRMLVKVQAELATITGIEEQREVVVAAIGTISSVSAQTAATAQEISSSLEEQTASTQEVSEHANRLVGMVDELKDSVARFKVENVE